MATIHILADQEKASQSALEIILKLWPAMKMLGLATGSTPRRLYKLLIQAYQEGKISFDIFTVNLDEYADVDPKDERSFSKYMDDELFNHVNVDKKKVRIPSCWSPSNHELAKTCIRMEKWIKEHGPVTIWILGIGRDAHIAFVMPGPKHDICLRYHVAQLSLSTLRANFGDNMDKALKTAITAGIETIKEGENLIQLAFGPEKEWAVSASILGPMTGWIPSSLLQDHAGWKVIVDQEAGAGILNYINESKVRPNEEGFYEVTSEAGITHQVKVSRELIARFSLPNKTLAELTKDMR